MADWGPSIGEGQGACWPMHLVPSASRHHPATYPASTSSRDDNSSKCELVMQAAGVERQSLGPCRPEFPK
ncbi:hypothetical protein D3C81_654250 [compost metagenome]